MDTVDTLNSTDLLQEIYDIQEWIRLSSIGYLRIVCVKSIVDYIDTCRLNMTQETKDIVDSETVMMYCAMKLYPNVEDVFDSISVSTKYLSSILLKEILENKYEDSEYARLPNDVIKMISNFI